MTDENLNIAGAGVTDPGAAPSGDPQADLGLDGLDIDLESLEGLIGGDPQPAQQTPPEPANQSTDPNQLTEREQMLVQKALNEFKQSLPPAPQAPPQNPQQSPQVQMPFSDVQDDDYLTGAQVKQGIGQLMNMVGNALSIIQTQASHGPDKMNLINEHLPKVMETAPEVRQVLSQLPPQMALPVQYAIAKAISAAAKSHDPAVPPGPSPTETARAIQDNQNIIPLRPAAPGGQMDPAQALSQMSNEAFDKLYQAQMAKLGIT